jgi:hypothetical protein
MGCVLRLAPPQLTRDGDLQPACVRAALRRTQRSRAGRTSTVRGALAASAGCNPAPPCKRSRWESHPGCHPLHAECDHRLREGSSAALALIDGAAMVSPRPEVAGPSGVWQSVGTSRGSAVCSTLCTRALVLRCYGVRMASNAPKRRGCEPTAAAAADLCGWRCSGQPRVAVRGVASLVERVTADLFDASVCGELLHRPCIDSIACCQACPSPQPRPPLWRTGREPSPHYSLVDGVAVELRIPDTTHNCPRSYYALCCLHERGCEHAALRATPLLLVALCRGELAHCTAGGDI